MTRPPTAPASRQARFLAVISHELRTPLTTIASFTESLDGEELAPAERSLALAAVRRNTDRMLALLDELMVVSRLQTGDLELTPAPLDPATVVREAADLLALREPGTDIEVRATDGPPITGDPGLLRTLVYAVLGTAAGGAPDRTATLTATPSGPPDDGWVIEVVAARAEQLTDEHLMAGMLADPQPPHKRRSAALWMLLADAIATRHGGSVRLTYDPATGAGCEVTLPLVIPSG